MPQLFLDLADPAEPPRGREADAFAARARELLAEVDTFKGQADPPGTMEGWKVRAQTLLLFEHLRRMAAERRSQ